MHIMRVIGIGVLVLGWIVGPAAWAAPRHDTRAREAMAQQGPKAFPSLKLWVEVDGKALAPGDTFRAGQAYRLRCRTNVPLSVAILHVGAANPVLLPRSGDKRVTLLGPGVDHRIPAEGLLRFPAQPGSRRLLVVFSRRPIRVIGEMGRLNRELLGRIGPEALSREIGRHVQPATGPTPGASTQPTEVSQDIERLVKLRTGVVKQAAAALARPDLMIHEDLSASAPAGGPGLYVTASTLIGDEWAAVEVDLVHQTPTRAAGGGATAKDIFYNPAPTPQAAMPTGRGVKYTILAGGIRPVTPSHEFKSGDRFQLKLETNANLYCRVFTEMPGPRIVQLYPGGVQPILIRKGQPTLIPAGRYFRFDTVPGLDRLILVFSPRPFQGFQTQPVVVTGLGASEQTLYNQLFGTNALDQARVATGSRSRDIHYVEDAAAGGQTGVYVVDTNPTAILPVVVDIVLIHR